MTRAAISGLVATVLVAAGGTAWAQSDDPPPPEALDDALRKAVLPELPEDWREVMEEVVVTGRGWRLPDLGATWRQEQEQPKESRVAVSFLPLYDPESEERLPDVFMINKQRERQGKIELFRIRFGAQPRRTRVPTVTDPDR